MNDLVKAYVDATEAPAGPPPEGYAIPDGLPKEMVSTKAKELGLSQDKLNGLLALQKEINAHVAQQQFEANESGLQKLMTTWGDKAPGTTQAIRKVMTIGDPDGTMTKFLKDTGSHNHPLVIGFLANIARGLMGEDAFIPPSGTPPPRATTREERMYPSMTAKKE